MARALPLVLALALAAPAAAAERAPEEVRALAGLWTVSSEASDARCGLTLTAETIPAGYVVAQPTPCRDPALGIEAVAAWRFLPDALVLVTITGALVARFEPEEDRLVSTTQPTLIMVRRGASGRQAL